MGHVDSRTTMRYLHHKSLDAEAELLAGAFAVDSPSEAEQLLLNATEDDEPSKSITATSCGAPGACA